MSTETLSKNVEVLKKRKERSPDMNTDELTSGKFDKREEERERQRKEREEREKQGLNTSIPKLKSKETEEDILKNTKSSGIYIPPFKMKRMSENVKDKKSIEYQKLNWEALKKTLNGIVNKINVSNIKMIIPELFSENLVRGRGLLCRAILKSQNASPSFSHVYSALIAVINTKMPEIGELLLKRIIINFRKSYQRNDKMKCIALTKFIAHLVNQQVANEILAGQIFELFLEKPTDDSVELAIIFMKECGYVLNSLAPKIVNAIFDRFRGILHEGEIDKRVQYLIEGLFTVRKKNFDEYPGVPKELDLIDPNDVITHEIELDDQLNSDDQLDYFHYDKDFEENEAQYESIKKAIIGDNSSEEPQSDETKEYKEIKTEKKTLKIEKGDKEELDSFEFKKQIYLTIMSSVNYEENVHKLTRAGLTVGREREVCEMIIECCSQEKNYSRYYALMAQRLCFLDKIFQEKFDESFKKQYASVHRLDTNKLRNIAKFFAHLLYTDALSWSVMEYIHLNEKETTSSTRIYVKILFQELCENLGIKKLNERLKDSYLKEHFSGIFPTDSANNMKFAINFWTTIGLGALTEELRILYKNAPKEDSDDSSDSSSDSDDSDDSDSSSDSE